MRMKIRKAVSLKPKPAGFFSASIPTIVSTDSISRVDSARGGELVRVIG